MPAVKAGDKVPSTTIRMMGADGRPAATTTDDYFAGKKVALFAVPGAFTPTCSAKHLPGYVEKMAELKASNSTPGGRARPPTPEPALGPETDDAREPMHPASPVRW